MPRLLLVDDNPSIHKIAETLLAASDIELVCLESGEEALRRVAAGESFDVALLDIAMAGLDGWGLLERLRALPATARMPIAMMAGVLDTVEPERIQQAPIQGFLKKPVELRDLAERVHKLLEIVVPIPTSAVDTIPAIFLDELVPDESDLLLLSAEDLLFPEETLPPAAPVPAAPEPAAPEPAAPEPATYEPAPVEALEEEALELEELDLETLQDLQETAAVPPLPGPPATSPEEFLDLLEPLDSAPERNLADAWADEAWEKPLRAAEESVPATDEMPFLVTSDELPDLGELVAAAEAPTIALESPAPVLELPPPETELSLEEELDLGPPPAPPAPEDDFSFALPAAGLGVAAAGAAAFALYEPPALAEPLAQPVPVEPVAAVTPPPLPVRPITQPEPSNPLLAALLSDPEAMAILAKAVATHLSDRTLKEIAWEVMPELAERLQR